MVYGLGKWTIRLVENWLGCWTQRVVIGNIASKWCLVTSGIYQGLVSVVLLDIFIGDLGNGMSLPVRTIG